MLHFGAAARAAAAGMARRDDRAGVHAALGDGRLQGGLQVAVKPVGVGAPQAGGARGGRDLRLPQHLVSQQVPDPGNLGLVEQPRLDRDIALADQGTEVRCGHLGSVRPERSDVGVQPDPPEPALVEEHQRAAVGELEGEPVPLGLGRLRVPAGRAAALGGVPRRRHDNAPAHAQVDAEVGSGHGRPAHAGGLAPHRLAPAAGGGQRPAGQRVPQLARGVRPADERIGVVDRDDTTVQRLAGDELAGRLDLGEFWHLPVLPVRTGRP
jgi:hypothetical protein